MSATTDTREQEPKDRPDDPDDGVQRDASQDPRDDTPELVPDDGAGDGSDGRETGQDAGGAARSEAGWATSLLHTTGLLLAVLLVAHVAELFVLHDIEQETAQSFGDRWSNPVWRAADWALIVLALVHGTIGVRGWLRSGVRRDRLRGALLGVVYVFVGVLLALVSFVAFTMEFRFN